MATSTGVGEKRKPGRPPGTAVPGQTKKATAASSAKRKARAEERRKQAELEKPRWKKLEDGDISVRDLSMEELLEGSTCNNDGTWEGRRHRFSPAWASKLDTERRRRIRNQIDSLAEDAIDAIKERILDDDAPAQQFAAARMVVEYQVGKVPDVVHVGVENEWDRLQQSAFRIERGEDAVVVPELESSGEDIVDAELVEEES